MTDKKQIATGVHPSIPSGKTALPRLNSADLLQGNRLLVIEHGNEEYRLQHTRRGKLILTK